MLRTDRKTHSLIGVLLVAVVMGSAMEGLMEDNFTLRRLSPRELECLTWVSLGKSSTDIGSILDLSSRTVDAYLEKACSKLNVRTRIEAVVAAVQMQIITQSD
ncbi:response regulator transcription factor [Brevundimonas naejangsanensis]